MVEEKTILLHYSKGDVRNISIEKFNLLIANEDISGLADFIVARFNQRFIEPFDNSEAKNGFAIMACSCLLIETLQCFKEGKAKSSKSPKLFKRFFKASKTKLNVFGSTEFYTNVRCGILHQGETTGGYKIRRDAKSLFDKNTLTIDATMFFNEMKQEIENYGSELKRSKWNEKILINFRTKMNSVISNCYPVLIPVSKKFSFKDWLCNMICD